MFLPPLLERFSMDDWLCDVVFTCKGKEYKRTIGTQGYLTMEQALQTVRDALISGRRKLPEDHWMARPPIVITDYKICRRHKHPRFKKETQELTTTELLAKGN